MLTDFILLFRERIFVRNIIEIGHLLYVIQVNSSSCIVQKPITWSWPPTLASSSLGPEVLRFSSLEYWMVVCFHVMADPWWSMYYLSGFISIWSFLHDICFKRRGSTGLVFRTKRRSCLLRTLWLVPREGDPRLCTVAVCSVGGVCKLVYCVSVSLRVPQPGGPVASCSLTTGKWCNNTKFYNNSSILMKLVVKMALKCNINFN